MKIKHTFDDPSECQYCFKTFNHRLTLKKHIDSNHSEIRHKCEKCDKEFTTRAVLNSHVKFVHENVKDSLCGHCKRSFGTLSGLKIHLKRGSCKNQESS